MKRLLVTLLLSSTVVIAAPTVQVSGLFKDTAVLTINGQQRMLRAGQRSPEGVLLVSATPKQAVIEIDGHRQEVSLSQHITGQYQTTEKQQVSIPRNNLNQYITFAELNGRRQQVLVDTGANKVAMSSLHARQLGIDYQAGVPSMVRTASGTVPSYRVTLRSVSVGDISASGVEAVVIEGAYPAEILLGMSYLERVDMREQNGTLYLQAKY